jgi:hypothetical protein
MAILLSSFNDLHTGIPDNIYERLETTRIKVDITHSYDVATSHTEKGELLSSSSISRASASIEPGGGGVSVWKRPMLEITANGL